VCCWIAEQTFIRFYVGCTPKCVVETLSIHATGLQSFFFIKERGGGAEQHTIGLILDNDLSAFNPVAEQKRNWILFYNEPNAFHSCAEQKINRLNSGQRPKRFVLKANT